MPQAPTPRLLIDFVSDVSCPWCAIGLSGLMQAIAALEGEVEVTLRCQPFELNPRMGPGGQDIGEHLTQKYGSTPEQQAQIRATIRARGEAVGFTFHPLGRGRIYNTFDAHRLLCWAGEVAPERQLALKLALLRACHTAQQAMDDPVVLLAAATEAGLDAAAAAEVLRGEDWAEEVREREDFYTSHGIHGVPAVIVQQRHLLSGAQPAEVYEQVLRELSAQPEGA
jgi:predicted DsbA family dithiol-disulfide isomerase